MFIHYWFLLPIGIAIAAIAMSSGISGVALWVPVYLLWLSLDPLLAFWLGLFTMGFGFGSGSYRNWRDRTFDAAFVRRYCAIGVPAAIIGGIAQPLFSGPVLVTSFGAFLVGYGPWLLLRSNNNSQSSDFAAGRFRAVAASEGLLTGLISIGTGVVSLPALIDRHTTRNSSDAVGTSVIFIFATSIAATVARLNPTLIAALGRDFRQLCAIMIWAAPAVVIGGQLGPRLARIVPSARHARLYAGAMLTLIGLLTLLRVPAIGDFATRALAAF